MRQQTARWGQSLYSRFSYMTALTTSWYQTSNLPQILIGQMKTFRWARAQQAVEIFLNYFFGFSWVFLNFSKVWMKRTYQNSAEEFTNSIVELGGSTSILVSYHTRGSKLFPQEKERVMMRFVLSYSRRSWLTRLRPHTTYFREHTPTVAKFCD